LVLAACLVAAIGGGWFATHRPEPVRRVCHADGVIGPDGTMYGRDPSRNCELVDSQGNPPPEGVGGR
jgi:hypothetical protein